MSVFGQTGSAEQSHITAVPAESQVTNAPSTEPEWMRVIQMPEPPYRRLPASTSTSKIPPVRTWVPPPLKDTLPDYRVDALEALKSATILLGKHEMGWGEPELITRTTNGWYEFRYGVTNQGNGNVILVNPKNGKAQFALPEQKRIGVAKAMELASKFLDEQAMMWPYPVSVTFEGSEPGWYCINYGTNWFGVEKAILVDSLNGKCRFSWIDEERPLSQPETHLANFGDALRGAKEFMEYYKLPWGNPQTITLATNNVFVLGYGADRYGNENTILMAIQNINNKNAPESLAVTFSADSAQKPKEDAIGMADALEAAVRLLKASKRNWGQPRSATLKDDGVFEINYGKDNVILVDPSEGKAYFRPEPLPL